MTWGLGVASHIITVDSGILADLHKVRQLGGTLAKSRNEVVRHLRQRLGVHIVRDNAAMMASRHPTFAPPEVDGDPD